MALVPCPYCGSQLTESERRRAACPICQKKFSHPAEIVKSLMAARPSAAAPSSVPALAPQPVKPIRKTARRIGGALLLIFAVGMLWVVGKEFAKWIGSGSWPRTMATITHSEVSEAIATSNRGRSRTVYRPSIRFKYSVDGQEFEGYRLGFGDDVLSSDSVDRWMSESSAKKMVARYPKDSTADIHYDARDPKYGVLTRGMDIAGWGMLGMVLFFFYLGLRLLCSALLSDGAAAGTKIWLFKRGGATADLICGGLPLLLFGVSQFMPGLFR